MNSSRQIFDATLDLDYSFGEFPCGLNPGQECSLRRGRHAPRASIYSFPLQRGIVTSEEGVIMTVRRLLYATAVATALGFGLCMLAAQPSFAQSAACVKNVGGVSSGWMGVKFGDSYYWSSSFGVTDSRCISLPVSGMVNGAAYTVVFTALLGQRDVPCTPNPPPYSSRNTNRVMYDTWGITIAVNCQMPSARRRHHHR